MNEYLPVQVFRKKYRSIYESKGIDAHDKKRRITEIAQADSKLATLTVRDVGIRIRSLGINLRNLRDYCRRNDLYIKRGREGYFVDSFIDDLAEEWVLREEVIQTFNVSRARFYQLIKEKKWPTLRIGKDVLVKVRKLVQSTKSRSLFPT